MRTIIFIALFTLLMVYVGGFNISFKPFYIDFPHWRKILGYSMISIGIALIAFDQTHITTLQSNKSHYLEGYKKGTIDSQERVLDILDEKYYIVNKDSVK